MGRIDFVKQSVFTIRPDGVDAITHQRVLAIIFEPFLEQGESGGGWVGMFPFKWFRIVQAIGNGQFFGCVIARSMIPQMMTGGRGSVIAQNIDHMLGRIAPGNDKLRTGILSRLLRRAHRVSSSEL